MGFLFKDNENIENDFYKLRVIFHNRLVIKLVL